MVISTLGSAHKLDARFKIIALLIFLLTNSLLPVGAWAAFILPASLLISAFIFVQLPVRLLIRRTAAIELAFLIMALPLLFKKGGPEIFLLNVANAPLAITSTGLNSFLTLLLKSLLSIHASLLLISTTSINDLLDAMQRLGFPHLMSSLVMLMVRYLSLLKEEVQRLLTARAARSGCMGKSPGGLGLILWQLSVTGGMAGNFLLRSLERSERVYQAMQARGYDGRMRRVEKIPLDGQTRLMIAVMLVFSLLILFFAYQIY